MLLQLEVQLPREERTVDLWISAGAVRITNIIQCSKIYGDEKHFVLQETLDNNNELTLKYLKSCVSCYTSKTHTKRHKRQRAGETDSNVPCKVTRHSQSGDSAEHFDFKKHCVFCGEFCDLKKDEKTSGSGTPYETTASRAPQTKLIFQFFQHVKYPNSFIQR